jgi:hypothetical protein
MTMRKLWIGLPLLLFAACAPDNSKMEQRIATLEKNQQELRDSLQQIQQDFIIPLEAYQDLVLREPLTHPDTLISGYKMIMEKYPNSFWSHEAKKRMKNIEERRKYWDDEHGWNFDVIFTPPEVISCPGC